MNRLRNSKGFTMVELIVVIGIIGILTAIMLPVFANSGKSQEANARAKSFYYAAQNVFIDYKADNTDSSVTEGYFKFAGGTKYAKDAAGGKNATYLYVCAYAEAGKGFTKVSVSTTDQADNFTSAAGYKCMAAPEEQASGDLLDALNTFSTTDDEGYYYALVDSQCRVVSAYWSKDDMNTLSDDTSGVYKKASVQFTDNYVVDYSVVGAFPTEYGAIGEAMFKS